MTPAGMAWFVATYVPIGSGVRSELAAIPWFLPGVISAALIGFAARGAVSRTFDTRPAIAWGLVVAVGAIVAATLTPSRGALDLGAVGSMACDVSRIALIPIGDLGRITDSSLNVLLFAPLGFAIGMIPRSRRRTVILLAAIVAPFAIEAVQLVAPALDRACQSADVVDNLTGLVVGLSIGSIAARMPPVRGRVSSKPSLQRKARGADRGMS